MPEIEEVDIHCDEANLASAAIPRRLGFRLAQIVDDEVDAPAESGRTMKWVMSRVDWG
jgi:RimJ/RimL family protein N-acetyltransferase